MHQTADMAHALHPNYADKHDPELAPRLGSGLVLKHNANQRYATNAISATLFRCVCVHRLHICCLCRDYRVGWGGVGWGGIGGCLPATAMWPHYPSSHTLTLPPTRPPPPPLRANSARRAGRCAGGRGCPPPSLPCAQTWLVAPPLVPSWPAAWGCAPSTSGCPSWPCTASERCVAWLLPCWCIG